MGSLNHFLQWVETLSEDKEAVPSSQRELCIPDVPAVGDLRVVFQPIVELQTEAVFAYEALVRGNARTFQQPHELFSAAVRQRYCGALGRAIREMAVAGCPDAALFMNIHPHELSEGWLVQPNDPIFRHECAVYLELTESAPLQHLGLSRSVLQEIRSKGVRLAVDDLGAGYSNLKYIADLAPEIVKLDRDLVTDVMAHERLRRLVAAVVRLCEDLGAQVVAEGIETREELAAVRDAGVHYGQGYFLAEPAYPPPRVSGLAVR